MDTKVKGRHGLYFLEVKWLDMYLWNVEDRKSQISSGTRLWETLREIYIHRKEEPLWDEEVGDDFLEQRRDTVQYLMPLGLEILLSLLFVQHLWVFQSNIYVPKSGHDGADYNRTFYSPYQRKDCFNITVQTVFYIIYLFFSYYFVTLLKNMKICFKFNFFGSVHSLEMKGHPLSAL